MKSYECSFNLCAWSFSNWSYVNGILNTGATSQSTLNHTSGEGSLSWGSYLNYEALDPYFLTNLIYTILNFDRDSMQSNFDELFVTSYFVNSLYESTDDVPAALNNLATGTTYKMMSGPNATQALGLVTEYQIYIHVQWPWLSLSIALVLIAVMLLVMTIVKTQNANLHPWKSSLYPLIFADSSRANREDRGGIKRWAHENSSKRAATIKETLLI